MHSGMFVGVIENMFFDIEIVSAGRHLLKLACCATDCYLTVLCTY